MSGKYSWKRYLGSSLFSAVFLVVMLVVLIDRKMGVAENGATQVRKLLAVQEKLRPLHRRLGRPRPGEWRHRFKEPGQTFKAYLSGKPTLPRGKRRTLYIQPMGRFSRAQKEIMGLTAQFMEIWFNLPVRPSPTLSLKLIPASARRRHPSLGMKQILSTYVLDKVLLPRLPSDAAAYIAFTAKDLWPGEGWNFVFGMANLYQRTGVWSLYRYGDPGKSRFSFRRCLLRTIKTAVHEVGHMFSMLHCTGYECVMCGSNSLGESDDRPLPLCPECLAKLCWATNTDPVRRFKELMDFCIKHGLEKEAALFRKYHRALATMH